MLTILSLNCFDISFFTLLTRRKRLLRLTHEIITLNPDVVCLQEINFRDTERLFKKKFENAGYSVFSPPTHSPRIPGGLFIASKYPLIAPRFTVFRDQGKIMAPDIVERIVRRGYITAKIHPKDTNPVTIFNTHLHCPMGAYEDSNINGIIRSQWTQLVSGRQKNRVIVTGDLNTIPENEMYPTFTNYLVDPLGGTRGHTVSTRNTNRKFLYKLNSRIDYTLVSPDLSGQIRQTIVFTEPVSDGTQSFYLSDHFGILTEIHT
jgi:endonuclease/exonuclease/phosphatase family metal-dependent hydrolase